jgi:hypothetical protein
MTAMTASTIASGPLSPMAFRCRRCRFCSSRSGGFTCRRVRFSAPAVFVGCGRCRRRLRAVFSVWRSASRIANTSPMVFEAFWACLAACIALARLTIGFRFFNALKRLTMAHSVSPRPRVRCVRIRTAPGCYRNPGLTCLRRDLTAGLTPARLTSLSLCSSRSPPFLLGSGDLVAGLTPARLMGLSPCSSRSPPSFSPVLFSR